MIRAILTSGSMRSLRHKLDRSCATKRSRTSFLLWRQKQPALSSAAEGAAVRVLVDQDPDTKLGPGAAADLSVVTLRRAGRSRLGNRRSRAAPPSSLSPDCRRPGLGSPGGCEQRRPVSGPDFNGPCPAPWRGGLW